MLKIEFLFFRVERREVVWITHTKPKQYATAVFMSRIPADVSQRTIKSLKATIQKAEDGRVKSLRHCSTDKYLLSILPYSDYSFTNSSNLSTNLDMLLF